ncbi:MAG: glycosyltransferase family 2 protein [Raineya sp.]|jgi:dolichol-phosphate mannosyltransferase|nr:glycosyltransferase family 2 protein [Raineya sp.]
MQVSILLPAFNEEMSLPLLLKKINTLQSGESIQLNIVVVNDGSTDKTLENIKGFNIILVDLKYNQGLAKAIDEGFNFILKELPETAIIVTMDSDNTHDPSLINDMITSIQDGAEIVIASRYVKGARIIGLSFFRQMLSLCASFLFRIVVPLKNARDYTCGYRAYKASLIKKAKNHYQEKFITQKGFGCMAEILVKLKLYKPSIAEIPLILHYNLKVGNSKMKILRTILQTFQLLFSTLRSS